MDENCCIAGLVDIFGAWPLFLIFFWYFYFYRLRATRYLLENVAGEEE